MARYHLSLFAGLLAGGLSAQSNVTAEVVTKTAVAAYARQDDQTGFDALAANTAIPASGKSANAIAKDSFAWTSIEWFDRAGVITVNFLEQGGVTRSTNGPVPTVGTSPSATLANLQPGPHSVLLKLSGKAGSKGLLEMGCSGGMNNTTGVVKGAYRVDIGDDSSVEFTGVVPGNYASQSFVVQIPASGTLIVRLESDVQATRPTPGSTLYKMGATLQFTPGPLCVGKTYGDFCSGLKLTGSAQAAGNQWSYSLKLTGGTASGTGLLVVGDRPLSVPIPGLQCPLLTTVLVPVPVVLDSTGTASWTFMVPQTANLDLRAQVADFGSATASNGLHAACFQ